MQREGVFKFTWGNDEEYCALYEAIKAQPEQGVMEVYLSPGSEHMRVRVRDLVDLPGRYEARVLLKAVAIMMQRGQALENPYGCSVVRSVR